MDKNSCHIFNLISLLFREKLIKNGLGLSLTRRPSFAWITVKIVGGKRGEVAVDKYGKPLKQGSNNNQAGLSFQGQRVLQYYWQQALRNRPSYLHLLFHVETRGPTWHTKPRISKRLWVQKGWKSVMTTMKTAFQEMLNWSCEGTCSSIGENATGTRKTYPIQWHIPFKATWGVPPPPPLYSPAPP